MRSEMILLRLGFTNLTFSQYKQALVGILAFMVLLFIKRFVFLKRHKSYMYCFVDISLFRMLIIMQFVFIYDGLYEALFNLT